VNDALSKLYQDVIVAHHKAPRNHGPLAGATHEATALNPLCGDEVTVRLRLDGGRVAEVRFESRGCVLSRAAASLMTEAVAGQPAAAADALGAAFAAFLGGGPRAGLGELTVLEGVRDFPSRVACVTLPWQALSRALAA
jgi:nitrogen fixation NifU-like protein